MAKNVVSDLFAWIRSALGTSPAVAPSSDLGALYQLAKAHDLAHLVSFGLKKNALLKKEDPVSAKFEKKLLQAVYTTERIEYETSRATALLEEAGIDHIPLKGSVLRSLYPESWMRTSCDTDILIHPEDCEKAIALLCEKLSYQRQEDHTLHDYQLISPGGVHLELHYDLIEDDLFPDSAPILNGVWEDSVPSQGFSHKREMSPEFFLFYHVVHMAKHLLDGGCGIRPFLDLHIMKEKMPFGEERFSQMLKSSGLETFYQVATELSSAWFEGKEKSPLALQAEEYILRGGVYGSLENQSAVKAGQGEKGGSSFLKMAFLNRESLAVIYPILKKKPYLFPFYQVKRWFRIFNPQKRKKVQKIASSVSAVSDEKKDATARFLADLGLR